MGIVEHNGHEDPPPNKRMETILVVIVAILFLVMAVYVYVKISDNNAAGNGNALPETPGNSSQ
jgi:hypothetical protein